MNIYLVDRDLPGVTLEQPATAQVVRDVNESAIMPPQHNETALKVRKGVDAQHNETALKVHKGTDFQHNETMLKCK